jgi:hypothetical protein
VLQTAFYAFLGISDLFSSPAAQRPSGGKGRFLRARLPVPIYDPIGAALGSSGSRSGDKSPRSP